MLMTARLLRLSHRCCSGRQPVFKPQSYSLTARRFRPLRTMAYSGARNTAIQLTQQEEELFGILLKTLDHQRLNTVLRCAGGWVRDKLLGKDSHDIDIAIDNKLGGEFAEHVNTYLTSQDIETRRIAVIESNPEQSKHLETARMKVAGLELDLVNLRSEKYADQTSRIPTMEFGTPEQDALRRDLTINSLFYNINTREVEDFTGKGLDDLLEHKLIRTPLPPSETFRDDPLRVLRAIRFGARFGFKLDEELEQAAASEPVRAALASKVSRERFGTEVDGMMNGPDPVRAVRDIQRLSLFPVVFTVGPVMSAALGDSYGEHCSSAMSEAESLLQDLSRQGEECSGEERRLTLLTALTLPLRACRDDSNPKPKQRLSAPSHIILNALKWKRKDEECVTALHAVAPQLMQCYHQLQSAPGLSDGRTEGNRELRVKLGRLLCELGKLGLVHPGLLLAPLLTLSEATPLGVDSAVAAAEHSEACPPSPEPSATSTTERRVEIYRTLHSAVEAFGLQGCWSAKPLLSGKEVMTMLGIQGKQVGKVRDQIADWQLANPTASSQECKEWLESSKETVLAQASAALET